MSALPFFLLVILLQASDSSLPSESVSLRKPDETDGSAPSKTSTGIPYSEQFSELVRNESLWTDYTEEVLRYEWAKEDSPPRLESSYLIRLEGRYRLHELRYPAIAASDSTGKSTPAPKTTLHQWDGNSRIQIRSNQDVEVHSHGQPPKISPPPYSIFLRELGFTGSIADFVGETQQEKNALIDVNVRVLSNSSEEFVIERRSRIQNGKTWKVITIRLLPAWDFLPISGSTYSESDLPVKASQSHRIEVQVNYRIRSDSALEYDLFCKNMDKENAGFLEAECRVRVHRVDNAVAFDHLRIHELVGNPTLRTYESGQLISEAPFRPKSSRPNVPMSPLETWFWLNNMFLALFIVYCFVRIFRQRQVYKYRTVIQTQRLESQHA